MSRRARRVNESGVVIGNVYDKYGSKNPIARRLMAGYLDAFDAMVRATSARSCLEVGCGEGHLLERLASTGMQVRGLDIDPALVEEARGRVERAGLSAGVEVRALEELTAEHDASELVVCCEVLEHVERPDEAIRSLARLARPYLLVSVPREPLWRLLNLARGAYVRDLGNTPGHLNHWSKSSFVDAIGRDLDVLAVRSPFPWTMVLARSRNLPA